MPNQIGKELGGKRAKMQMPQEQEVMGKTYTPSILLDTGLIVGVYPHIVRIV